MEVKVISGYRGDTRFTKEVSDLIIAGWFKESRCRHQGKTVLVFSR